MSQHAEAEAYQNGNEIENLKSEIAELRNLIAVNNNMVNDRCHKKDDRRFSFNDVEKLINEFMEANREQNECCRSAGNFVTYFETKVVLGE